MEKNEQEKWLDQALEIIDAEEELEGPMPPSVLNALQNDPTKALRALVKATKNSIKERLIEFFEKEKEPRLRKNLLRNQNS